MKLASKKFFVLKFAAVFVEYIYLGFMENNLF